MKCVRGRIPARIGLEQLAGRGAPFAAARQKRRLGAAGGGWVVKCVRGRIPARIGLERAARKAAWPGGIFRPEALRCKTSRPAIAAALFGTDAASPNRARYAGIAGGLPGAAFVDGAGAESRAPRLLGGFVQRIIKFIAAREKTLDKSRGAWYTMKCRSIG